MTIAMTNRHLQVLRHFNPGTYVITVLSFLPKFVKKRNKRCMNVIEVILGISLIYGALLTFQYLVHVWVDGPSSYSLTNWTLNESLCSDRATARGKDQQVVSFSFYSSMKISKEYLQEVEENAKALPTYYHKWTMRLYHEVMENDTLWPIIREVEEKYPHVDLCNINSLPVLGNIKEIEPLSWRFLPLADRLVKTFVSRDLDSLPSLREAAAVTEWLSSNLSFHVMRDHPGHQMKIIGGLWGARRDVNPSFIDAIADEMWKEMLEAGPFGLDLDLLSHVIWPRIKDKVMQHDSYHCEEKVYRENGNIRPWPTKRQNQAYNYVGLSKGRTKPLQVVCPPSCRPPRHMNWLQC